MRSLESELEAFQVVQEVKRQPGRNENIGALVEFWKYELGRVQMHGHVSHLGLTDLQAFEHLFWKFLCLTLSESRGFHCEF